MITNRNVDKDDGLGSKLADLTFYVSDKVQVDQLAVIK